MNDFNAHKSLVAGAANRTTHKVPTSAMQRDKDGLYGLRIKCELVALAALVGILIGCVP